MALIYPTEPLFKTMKKRANEKATIGPHKEALNNLQNQLRDEEERKEYLDEFVTPSEPHRVMPSVAIGNEQSAPSATDRSASIAGSNNNNTNKEPTAPAVAPTVAPPRKKRAGRRCRTCGLELSKNMDRHVAILPEPIPGERPQNRFLFYRTIYKCNVPLNEYEEGYPLKEGQLHIRRSRKRKKA